jgi:hypothetical protein
MTVQPGVVVARAVRDGMSGNVSPEPTRSMVHDVVNSTGQSLAPDIRDEMEGRLGHSFADVRVHTDAHAKASARAVQADAYTTGRHVVFPTDRFDPRSPRGKRMLAHELTHVIQQREGAVPSTSPAGGITVSQPSDHLEHAAEAAAEQGMTRPVQRSISAESDESRSADVPNALFVQRMSTKESETDSELESDSGAESGSEGESESEGVSESGAESESDSETEDDRVDAEHLKSVFPQINITYYPSRKEVKEFWAEHMKRGSEPIKRSEFIESLLGKVVTDDERTGIRLALRIEGQNMRITVGTGDPKLAIDPRANPKPFTLNQTYLPNEGNPKIYLESVVATRQGNRQRGKEFIKEGLLPLARELGVSKIELKASRAGGLEGGQLAWARYGFVPTVNDWNSMRLNGLKRLKERKFAPYVREKLEEILLDPSPKALRRLVYLSWKEEWSRERNFLNQVLTSNGNGWNGEIDLSDPDSLKWIETYADSGSEINEEELRMYSRLRPEISGIRQPVEPVEVEPSQGADPGRPSLIKKLLRYLAGAAKRKLGQLRRWRRNSDRRIIIIDLEPPV